MALSSLSMAWYLCWWNLSQSLTIGFQFIKPSRSPGVRTVCCDVGPATVNPHVVFYSTIAQSSLSTPKKVGSGKYMHLIQGLLPALNGRYLARSLTTTGQTLAYQGRRAELFYYMSKSDSVGFLILFWYQTRWIETGGFIDIETPSFSPVNKPGEL